MTSHTADARRFPKLVVLAVLLSVAGALPVAATELDAVLAEFDRVQSSIRTLSAEFVETTTTPLLMDDIVARGRVYLTKPNAVRWEYTTPEEMRFVIADNQYTGYFPHRKRAERRDIQRWSEQLFRFLGLGQASNELSRFYSITLESPSPQDGTYVLLLDPKKKRVRKRMDGVRFTVDATTFLPVRVEYSGKNGNVRVIQFDEMRVNPELAAQLYIVDLPDDVQVSKGFSALSGFAGSTEN